MQLTAQFVHGPDPDHPGWHTWGQSGEARFNTVGLGRMVIRHGGGRSARRRRLQTDARHSHIHDNLHGGNTVALIDVAMFATIHVVLMTDAAGSETFDLHNQFIGSGRIDRPLHAVSEFTKETGRFVFLRGSAKQDGALVSSFISTLHKPSTPQ